MATTDGAADAGFMCDPQLGAEWLAAGWARDVAPGCTLALRVMGRDVVLWRGADDELHCWLDLCIHRGAKLSLGTIVAGMAGESGGSCLACPYHGWRYAGTGQCVGIPAQPGLTPPAKARATTYDVRERYGVIWVCLGQAGSDVPEFGVAGESGFRTLLVGPYRFRALGPRLIENFLDVAHLGIVHAGVLGDPSRGEMEDYEVGMGLRGPEAKSIRIWQPDPDGTGRGATVTYRYEVLGPLTAAFVKLPGDGGGNRLGILMQVMPVDREFSEMRMIMAMNYGEQIPDGELIAFQDRVVEQDRRIVESQRPELLPLDLQAELHLRSDRMAIAYRKWLKEIGFTYGVA